MVESRIVSSTPGYIARRPDGAAGMRVTLGRKLDWPRKPSVSSRQK